MRFFRRLIFASIFPCVLLSGVKSRASVSGYLSFGYGRGGSKLSDLTGGQNYNTEAGSGLFMTGGAIFPISPTTPNRFEAQVGFGYLFQDDGRNEENRVSWSRIPLEFLYFYHHTREQFRLGYGLTYQLNGKISAKGTNSSAETNVDNALGWVINAEKLWSSANSTDKWSVGIRYVQIKYNLSKFSKEADGSAWFLTMSAFSF